ncbi:hypothetical protein QNH20_24875 [Neobacillus sp. WH10]|uniref:hypothetical protein n=1 Tax=Neobacillus sp. WH10 TaxID=3047873 RepID=UPI0024C1966A|nr:hypothetical protein [Neobacillus sp. WH10]WHY77268.1 hypothetical protein QNH20_24875 [Neobacillus sp. WH10]
MRRYFLFGVIVGIAALVVFLGYEQVLEAKERERDLAHLNYIPIVRVGEQQLEIYEYGQCKEDSNKEEKAEIGPSSCDSLTEEEALKGKTAASFNKESELTIKNIKPSGELEFKGGPANGVRRIVSGGYTKDGKSLGPNEMKIIVKDMKDEFLETVTLPKDPGYFVGRITLSTPSGNKNYVYHFYYK